MGVDGRGQPPLLGGDDLLLHQLLERSVKFRRVSNLLVAEFCSLAPAVAGHSAVVAAVFRQADGPLLLGRLFVVIRPEIPVNTFDVPAALIVPAAGVVDRPGIIPLSDKLRSFQGVKLPPALVKGYPQRQTHGIVQQVYHLSQLLVVVGAPRFIAPGKIAVAVILDPQPQVGEYIDRQRGIALAAVHHILPYQHPQPVTVVVPAQRLHLDVLAQHIKAQPLHFSNVMDQRLIAGGGVVAVAPVALVQQSVLEIGLSIQQQPRQPLFVLPNAEGPHPEVAFHPVAARQDDGNIVEERLLRAPQAQFLCRDGKRALSIFVGLPFGNDAPIPANRDSGHGRVIRLQPNVDRIFLRLWGNAQGPQIIFRYAFHPHRLPNARLRRVPDAGVFQPLLAAGKGTGIGGVGDTKLQRKGIALNKLGHIQGKGQVAPGVTARFLAVDPHGAAQVHRPEMKEQPAALEKALRQGDAAAVPQVLIRLQDVSHPGKRGLRRKGHHDLPLHGSGLFGRFGNGIFPYAVQVQVAVSPQLGAGVFRQRVLPVKCLSPGCQHGFGHGSSAFLSWFQQGAGAAPQGTALRAV